LFWTNEANELLLKVFPVTDTCCSLCFKWKGYTNFGMGNTIAYF